MPAQDIDRPERTANNFASAVPHAEGPQVLDLLDLPQDIALPTFPGF